MLTDAITFILFEQGFEAVNYIDDFGGADTVERVWHTFYELGNIIQQVGLTEVEDNASPSSHIMVFLGLEVNTIKMTIRIPAEKLREIRSELDKWFLHRRAGKKQIQRLVGLLNFAAGCIKPGRIYFSRILNFLRNMDNVTLFTEDVMMDIIW